jgi:hypothetical protein
MPTAAPRITARDLTYGIEIECGINHDAPVRPGSYHAGNVITALPASTVDGVTRNWRADRDGSLHFRNAMAVEFVSPILRGADGLDNIRAACAQIKAWGGKTNRSCGLHVHVAFPTEDVAAMRRLTKLVGRFEDALYAASGTPDRRNGGYCRPIKTERNKSFSWNVADKRALGSYSQPHDLNDRYRILNWTNFISGRFNAVEFRVFSGSLNPAKIAAWVQICLTLVEMALDNCDADWDIRSSDLGKYGRSVGEQQVGYMCRYCWFWRRRRDRNYGDVGHSVFTREVALATLKALAVRHDERAGVRQVAAPGANA